MARSFARASSQYLEIASNLGITGEPLSLALWYRYVTTTGAHALGGLYNVGSTGGSYGLFVAGDVANDPLRAWKVSDGGTGSAYAQGGNNSVNKWTFGGASYVSDTSRFCYKDTSSGSSGTNVADPTPSNWLLGAQRQSGGYSNYVDGAIAYPAVWNIDLTNEEWLMLAAGAHPFTVRPGNLIAFWPLDEKSGGARDIVGGYDLTASTSEPTWVPDPPILMRRPARSKSVAYVSVSGGGQTLTPGLFTNSSTFYAPTASPGAVALTPGLFTNSSTFHAPTVSSTYALAAPLYADADTFYAATILADRTLQPGLFSDADTFHAATVSGAYALAPSLYVDPDTIHAATVVSVYLLAPSLYTDPDAFYSPAVSATYTLTPGLYDDGDTFYTHVVSLGGSQTLVPGLYVDSDTFYSPTVSSTYTLTPALYADPDTFYSATISSTYVIAPTLYVDADTFYAATVGSFGEPQTLLPSLYVDPDTFYVHTITGGLGSGVGQRTRYITVEFYDGGDVWRTNIARDILEYSTQPSKIAFSYVSPQDSISYASGTDKIHYTRGQVMGSIQRRSAFKKVFVAPPPPPPPPTDPYFSNVVALLHMDGADASTTFTDVKGHVFTAAGNAQIDTAQSKFGGASGLFDGTGDYVSTPTSSDFAYGTGDFTWEGHVRLAVTTGNQYIIEHGANGGTVTYNGGLKYYNPTTGTGSPLYTTNPPLVAGTWHHIAVARQSGTTRLFVDGVLKVGAADSHNYAAQSLRIGDYGGGGYGLNGNVDEIRITKGVARYTADFTPPTEPFLDQ